MSRSEFNAAVDISAPPECVFSVLCDVERWPEWTSTMAAVERLERGAFALGSSARVHQPNLRPAVWKVTQFDENRNFTWIAKAPFVHMQAAHLIEAQGANCRVLLSFQFTGLLGPIAARLYRGLIQRYLATEAQGLKRHSESLAQQPHGSGESAGSEAR